MQDCIFCKIINKEIPSKIVYEDDKLICFHDVSPMADIHVLVVPKIHVESINDLNEESAEYVKHAFLKIPDIAESLGIKGSGYRTIINTGVNAGQTVKHLHIHILGGSKLPEKLV